MTAHREGPSERVRLVLPIPPSPNRWKHHPMELHRQKNAYRKQAWAQAVVQVKPTRDPPERVRVRATFYMARLTRDEDNLTASLKFVGDCLKQRQTGDLWWRQSVADLCGYFTEDDPAHLILEKPVQLRVKTKREERLELEIEGIIEEAA